MSSVSDCRKIKDFGIIIYHDNLKKMIEIHINIFFSKRISKNDFQTVPLLFVYVYIFFCRTFWEPQVSLLYVHRKINRISLGINYIVDVAG